MKKGFTLIELLVVVLIIGILSAIALPQYQKAVIKTRYTGLKNLVEGLVKAERVYQLSNGTYTDAFENLDITLSGGTPDNSIFPRYIYDWGYCYLSYSVRPEEEGIEKINIGCLNTDIHMAYYAVLEGEELRRNCVAVGSITENDYPVQNAICKNETGLTRHTAGNSANTVLGAYLRYKY